MSNVERKFERRLQRRRVVHATVGLGLGPVMLLHGATAYEHVRSFSAAELLPAAQIEGPHHRVASTVPTEGYLHVFEVSTDWGTLEAEGLGSLRVRLEEIRALAELEDVSKSEVFLNSAAGAVLNVGKGVGAVVADPGATAKGLGHGVKRFGTNLGRKAKRTSDQAVDAAKTSDDKDREGSGQSGTQQASAAAGGVASSALGVSASARKWAQKVGSDPYTTNAVLKKALEDLGKIDAAGNIAAKLVVPIPPVVSATASVGSLVWSKDPEALLKENEAQLRALGVSSETIKQLYLSKGFTLTLHTRLAQALSAVKARGSADYVAAAAEAHTEREALFFTESAKMLRRFHATDSAVELLADSRALVAKTKSGLVVALVPVDWIQWTEAFAKAAAATATRARKELTAARLELHLTGRASSVAKKEAAALGWKMVEHSE